MSLNKSIIDIRVELQNSKLKKSGLNKFAGFTYYELSDFLPKLNELMKQYEINDIFSIKDGVATLTIIKDKESQEYCIPFVLFDTPKNKNGTDSMQHIQYLGALNTYYKRYLYLNAFGITDGEVIDAMEQPTQPTASNQDLVKYVADLIAQTNTDPMAFCAAYKVQSYSAMTTQQLQDGIKKLSSKLK